MSPHLSFIFILLISVIFDFYYSDVNIKEHEYYISHGKKMVTGHSVPFKHPAHHHFSQRAERSPLSLVEYKIQYSFKDLRIPPITRGRDFYLKKHYD